MTVRFRDVDSRSLLASLLSDANTTLGVTPALEEESLFSEIEEALNLRIDSWKVKIEEGVTLNSESGSQGQQTPNSKPTRRTAADKVQPSLFTSEELPDAAKEGGAQVWIAKGKAVSAIDGIQDTTQQNPISPALVQVSHPDPFWKPDTVNFVKIAEASKETTTEPAGSWTAV
ncbi:hypothetical protein Pst134EB_012024 [Puccinia striiformis f. sp. tritici]|nr:hypothetical protein Pst134EB_012024 [Puccinia striiformis f. sp. tritici]